MNTQTIEQKSINTLRILSADLVEQAQSGHPGMPMGAAAMAYVLWTKFLKHNPKNPEWFNRDRFVLSGGHGSALLYSLLHLTGYALSLDDLKSFRQLGSKTPGHPEYGHTVGVETTTGPLGQGFATAVGMAMAERFLAEYFNTPEFSIVDYNIYGICGDGDLMEGITSEAASIAGHLKLGKMIILYDDNNISIEGSTDLAFSESVRKRFEAYGWQVLTVDDGNDIQKITAALESARENDAQPSLIKVKTKIGFGSPNKQDTAQAHGEPLGPEELKLVKAAVHFPQEEMFYIPKDVLEHYRQAVPLGQASESGWLEQFKNYSNTLPEKAKAWKAALAGQLPSDWQRATPVFKAGESMATRQASGKVLNALSVKLPFLVGGAADLAPSTATHLKGQCDFSADHFGCPNFHFGVREHAMGAAINGMALSHMLRPYGATFLIFSDYMRPAIRLAALMDIPSTFIFTHDSIGLGEDGPTHQPVEQLAALRAIPNLIVFRPADANETAMAWQWILEQGKPAVLALSRQALPVLDSKKHSITQGVAHGAYVLRDCEGIPEVILIATGSEVHLALAAQEKSEAKVRVVSMPSWERFAQQTQEYQDEVLPPTVSKRISIEAGISQGWEKWVGNQGYIIALDRFGASGKGAQVFESFGFTVKTILEKIAAL